MVSDPKRNHPEAPMWLTTAIFYLLHVGSESAAQQTLIEMVTLKDGQPLWQSINIVKEHENKIEILLFLFISTTDQQQAKTVVFQLWLL